MRRLVMFAGVITTLAWMGSTILLAHCDTLSGPVAVDARAALLKQDVTPALKWVRASDEEVIRKEFEKALNSRCDTCPYPREAAELAFIEAVVKRHRIAEGEPFEGLKPPGDVEPEIRMADLALQTGQLDQLIEELSMHIAGELRERFARAAAAKATSENSVEAGRSYVAAYAEYLHYVETLHKVSEGETVKRHN